MLNLLIAGFIFLLGTISQIIVAERLIINVPHQQVGFLLKQTDHGRQKGPLLLPFLLRQKLIRADLITA